VIDTLINELNDKFLTELGPVDNPVKIGPSEQSNTGNKVKFIFVGSSRNKKFFEKMKKKKCSIIRYIERHLYGIPM
jgi:hypothetical protein